MATYKKYKKKNGQTAWELRAYLGIDPVNGQEIRTKRRGFDTKREAQVFANQLMVEIAKKGIEHNDVKTYRDIYHVWLDAYKPSVKESTLFKTLGIFKRLILPAFGRHDIKKIDILYCQKIMNRWSKKYSRSKMYMNYAGLIFKYAIKLGVLEKNPVEYVTVPHASARPEDKSFNFYDKKELAEFFDTLNQSNNERAKTFFRILAFTGMRRGEALALTWQDVDFGNSTIKVNKTLSRGLKNRLIVQTPKTVNGYRTIDVDDITIQLIKQWQIQIRKAMFKLGYNIKTSSKQLVFPNVNNSFTNPSRPRVWLYRVYKQNPQLKHISVHGFRHTHASLLFEAGASIKEVQERLGHGDIKTTMNIYAHVTQ
ncbi:tyrosine-type recombinase/integrase, partial [Loigolactobacillus rennini]